MYTLWNEGVTKSTNATNPLTQSVECQLVRGCVIGSVARFHKTL